VPKINWGNSTLGLILSKADGSKEPGFILKKFDILVKLDIMKLKFALAKRGQDSGGRKFQ
jgi:hypothetical protein